MQKLIKTKDIVQTILEENQTARNSDSFLYLKVLERIAAEKGDPRIVNIPINEFLLCMSEQGFPPFESVRRTRQKVQQDCPWLASCEKVSAMRAENEQIYRKFARGEF